MSWNAPQTLTEAIKSVEMGWSFQSHLGVKGEPIWVLTDITRDFPASTGDFANDLIRRNWSQRDRYLNTHERTELPDDLVYVVGRDGALLVGMLRDGSLLLNDEDGLSRKQRTFRDNAAEALKRHAQVKGHLTQTQR